MNITLAKNPYYRSMLHKNRLMPFFIKDRLVCFITFYLTDEPEKYLNRENLWSVEEDNPDGKFCIIDQLWTDKKYENCKLSYGIWARFKFYVSKNFPSVKIITWRRYKNGIVETYKKEMKK